MLANAHRLVERICAVPDELIESNGDPVRDSYYLIPIAIGLGLCGLAAFLWSLKDGQYDDMKGAAERILDQDDVPLSR
jgi:cbb3-type cytochrome oxidase maturation protein